MGVSKQCKVQTDVEEGILRDSGVALYGIWSMEVRCLLSELLGVDNGI